MASGSRDKISWSQLSRPKWVDRLEEFARDPSGYIWTIIISGVLVGWEYLLSYLDQLWRRVALVPIRAIAVPLTQPLTVMASRMVRLYSELGRVITSVVVELGLPAPIGAVLAWTAPVIMLAVVLNVLIGIVGTYVPLRSIPYIGEELS